MSDDRPDPQSPTRRELMHAVGAALMAAPFLALALRPARAATAQPYSTRAIDLVRHSLVIDMLSPLRLDLRDEAYSVPLSDDEAAAFRASGITGFHHAIGIGGPDAYEKTLAYFAGWQGFAGRNSSTFALVGKASDLEQAKGAGKAAVIMGAQNAEHFRSADDVRAFHQIGMRCAQLTYNSQTLIGSGCTERVDGGISDYGAKIIDAMGEVGMLVDVSHCGDRTTLDAIELAKGPIAITHANCRALNNHPRLKTDEAIRKLAAKGGVMGVTGVRMFVSAVEPTTVANIVDHIDHVVKLVGIEHVGVGSDADLAGYDAMPADQRAKLHGFYKSSYAFRDKDDTDGFSGATKIYSLTEALIARGYSNANIEAILGGNFRRLLGAVWH